MERSTGDGGPDVYDHLGDASLTVVSNREPYVHEYDGDEIVGREPMGGLVTALGDVVAETGGTWVAWGSGDADFDPAVAPAGEVGLPPADPAYTLSRVDLPPGEVDDFYYGYANQVLWPLCHTDTNYVSVDPDFYPAYERANRRYAEAACATSPDVVWFQDYHLALAPRLVRKRRPGARLVHFWHIPWPDPEVFEICPHARALLDGLLANDALGFHLGRYAENFLDAVAQALPDATVERWPGADGDPGTGARTVGRVTRDGHRTRVYASPVGIDADHVAASARSDRADRYWGGLLENHGIDADTTVAVSVDRLDYTKGLLERLDAVDHLFATRPDLRGELTLVQKATQTRERIPTYCAYQEQVRERVAAVNRTHGSPDWTPVVHVEGQVEDCELGGLYRNADVGVVSPRRDGMNLVAKEYVAASEGTASSLVCSRFAGAAEALCPAALPVNPFDVAGFADALERAVRMDSAERRERMARLVEAVRADDLDAWLADQVHVLAGPAEGGRLEAPGDVGAREH